MIYQYDKSNNNKLFLMYFLAGLCVIAGVSTFFFLSPLFATIATVLGMYIAFLIMRSLKKLTSSRIETYSDGFTVYFTTGGKLSFEWNKVSHCGIIMNGPTKDYVFASSEEHRVGKEC